MQIINQEIVNVPVGALKPHPRNARQGDVGAIHTSIAENGFYGVIIAQRSTGYILAGNHRWRAAVAADAAEVPVCWLDVDDDRALRILLADNRTNDIASYDDAALAEMLEDILNGTGNLDGTGFSPDDLDDLLKDLRPGGADDEAAPGPSLVDRFGIPPFSVFDTKQGYWQERKKAWKPRIGDNGETREGLLMAGGRTSDPVSAKMQEIANGVSVLDPVLVEVCLRFFAPAGGSVLDTCAGDSVAGFVSGALGHPFTGIELRQEQATLNQQRADGAGLTGVRYFCDDGANVGRHVPAGSVDFYFSCPPYYDLEQYSDDPRDLSNAPTYRAFMDSMAEIFREGLRCLRDDRFAVLVVGDVRDRVNGGYYGFTTDCIRAMTAVPGVQLWNHIVLLESAGTKPLTAAKPLLVNRKLTKCHQDVLVFYKGDPARIRHDYGAVEIADLTGADDV
jgi:hypothetical protein